MTPDEPHACEAPVENAFHSTKVSIVARSRITEHDVLWGETELIFSLCFPFGSINNC